MNIDRHNYEEFFLLYVDNELTAGEKTMVRMFLDANPDLKIEFDLLQQTKTVGAEKLDETFLASLLKPTENETTITEEQLLMYVDNELETNEKQLVEREISADKKLQAELKWLQLAKLSPEETIQFADKSLLYKKEPAKLFVMSGVARRWSAAAAVVVLLASALWLMQDNRNQQPVVVKGSEQQPVTTNPVSNKAAVEQSNNRQSSVSIVPNEKEKNTIESGTSPKILKANSNNQQPVIVKTKAVQQRENVEIKQTVPNETMAINNSSSTEIQKKSATTSNNLPTVNVPIETATAKNITYASFNDEQRTEDDKVFFNEERQRRTGLKAFVKKAKRIIERKTGIETGDSEVRFAMFAVNAQ